MRTNNTNEQQLLADNLSIELREMAWLGTNFLLSHSLIELSQIDLTRLSFFEAVLVATVHRSKLLTSSLVAQIAWRSPWTIAPRTQNQQLLGLAQKMSMLTSSVVGVSNGDLSQDIQAEGRLEMSTTIKWLTPAFKPQSQVNGEIFWDGVLMDMTKCTHDSTRWNKEQVLALFEQEGIGVAAVGLNGQFLQVNPKLCQITGYSREELLSKTIFQLTHPEDQAVDRLYLRLLKSQQQTYQVNKRYVCQTGAVIWVNVNVSVVRDPLGNPKFYIGMIEEIRDCLAQEAVGFGKAQLSSLTETTDLILSSTGTIRHTSLAFGRLIGYEHTDLVGQDLFKLIHSEDNLKVNKLLTEMVQEQRGELLLEFRVRHQNGNWQTIKAIGESVLDQTGGMNLVVKACQTTAEKAEPTASSERFCLFDLAAQVGEAIANRHTLAGILRDSTEAISEQLNAISTAIWTVNPTTQQLEQRVTSGQIFPLDDVIKFVAQTRQPQALQQQTPPNYLAAYPLIWEDQFFGVLAVLSNCVLSEEVSEALKWVANAIAKVIKRPDSESNYQESRLFELTNQIRNSLELEVILETAVQSLLSLLQTKRSSFAWYNNATGQWQVVAEAKQPNLASHLGCYQLAEIEQIVDLENHQIRQIEAVADLPNLISRQFFQALGYTSVLLIPLPTQAGEIGVIFCGDDAPRIWEARELELLQVVIQQLAKAIEQAALYQQAKVTAKIAQAQAQQLELALKDLQSTQARLVQSEKMSSLGQLVAGIAHEINNPVNFIHGNLAYASAYFYDILSLLYLYQEHYPMPAAAIVEQSEMINLNFIAKDLPKLLNSMQRGTDRIRSIVLSLRHFSRLDEADMKQSDLHEGIESTLSILQHRLHSKGQHPEIQVFRDYADLPNVQCYPGQLNQVFMNIISNAIEALHQPPGENQDDLSLKVKPTPAITISTSFLNSSESHPSFSVLLPKKPDQKMSSVLIRIADNGPGMSELVRTKLFDPFFTTKPVGQGIGLGLSISYQIVVEHHRGVLTCTSTPGKGTEFWIEIPIHQDN